MFFRLNYTVERNENENKINIFYTSLKFPEKINLFKKIHNINFIITLNFIFYIIFLLFFLLLDK